MVVEGALGFSTSAHQHKIIEKWRYKHATVSISGISTVKLLLSKIRGEIVDRFQERIYVRITSL